MEAMDGLSSIVQIVVPLSFCHVGNLVYICLFVKYAVSERNEIVY